MLTACVVLTGCRDWSFVDQGRDAGVDAGFDASFDASFDAGFDAGDTPDAAPLDGPRDAPDVDVPDAPTDAGPDASDAGCIGCDCLDAPLACEDFESPLAVELGGTGAFARIDGMAATGASVGRFRVISGGDSAFVRRSLAPLSSGRVWLRAFVRVVGTSPISGLVLASVGSGGSTIELDLVEADGADQYGVAMTFGSMDSAFAGPPSTRDVWECLEVRIDIGGAGGFELFRDGASLGSRGAVTTIAPGYDTFTFGVAFSRPTQASIDLLFDDVVLARERVGCAR